MKFSIIIPTKDRPHLLKRALASVLLQSFQAFEVIVVDDGDGSGQKLASQMGNSKITAISSERAGQVRARSKAIEIAKGMHLAWLDDDDWWETEHLKLLDAVLSKSSCLAYSSGWIAYETDTGGHISTSPFKALATRKSLRENNTLLWSGLAYPAEFHQKFGLFDPSLAYYWDWDWYLRLADMDVKFASTAKASVWISARTSSVSAAQNEGARRSELDRLQTQHNLGLIALKNHAGIAEEQIKAEGLGSSEFRA